MKCEKCGFENSDDAKFCTSCGNKIGYDNDSDRKRRCPFCGSENKAEARFCGKCGNDMFAPQRISNPAGNKSGNSLNADRVIAKITCMVIGLIGVIIPGKILYDEANSWFDPDEEKITVCIIFIVISVIVFIVGCGISLYSDNNNTMSNPH